MRIRRSIRPSLCALLAFSIAIGPMSALARACTCGMPPSPVPTSAQNEKPASAIAPCCGESSCCRLKCCEPAVQPKPHESTSAESSCSCLNCECESPLAPRPPDSAPPPAPVDSGSLQFVSAPPAPPVLMVLSSEAFPRFGEAHSEPPPVDLITTLSRLTC
jgi:hypothetical protein